MPMPSRPTSPPRWPCARRSRAPARRRAEQATFDFYVAGIRSARCRWTPSQTGRPLHRARAASTPPGVVGMLLTFFFDGTATRRASPATARSCRRASRRDVEVAARAAQTAIDWKDGTPVKRLGRAAAQARRPIRRSRAGTLDPVSAGFRAAARRAGGRGLQHHGDVFDGSRRVAAAGSIRSRRRRRHHHLQPATTPASRARRSTLTSQREFPFSLVFAQGADGDARGCERIEAPTNFGTRGARPAGAERAGRWPRLPIEPVLPALVAALAAPAARCCRRRRAPARRRACRSRCSRRASRGRGSCMLEPRRVAARAAAERLAEALGERPGGRVGYRMRGEAVPGSRHRGGDRGHPHPDAAVGTRTSPGVGCVIFDEFHERSLQADLGLALALEVRGALRPDLALLVMSATLDAAPVAALMGDAPVVTAEGRAFPVETRWLERPWPARGAGPRLEEAVADLVARTRSPRPRAACWSSCPARREIARTAARLAPRLPPGVVLQPLHGGLPFAAQRAALAPLAEGRRLVLATAIAETSLTIPDVRVVVDAGRARRARFDPGLGHDPPRHRAGHPRRGRAAPRPRRPGGAGLVLPALDPRRGGRARRLPAARDRQRRSRAARARARALGRRRARTASPS